MLISIWTFIILLSQAVFQFTAAIKPVVVNCNAPVLSTVAVDETHHKFYPYFVRLYRCEGSYNYESPNIKKCVATERREVRFSVQDMKNGQRKEIILENHTRCGPECKASPDECNLDVQEWNEQSCQCKCMYPHSPPPENVMKRRKGLRWNSRLCQYDCNKRGFCSREKMWSKEDCSCICKPIYEILCNNDDKFMDPKTCTCKDPMKYTAPQTGFITYTEFAIVLGVSLGFAAVVIICLIVRLCSFGNTHETVDQGYDNDAVDQGHNNDTGNLQKVTAV